MQQQQQYHYANDYRSPTKSVGLGLSQQIITYGPPQGVPSVSPMRMSSIQSPYTSANTSATTSYTNLPSYYQPAPAPVSASNNGYHNLHHPQYVINNNSNTSTSSSYIHHPSTANINQIPQQSHSRTTSPLVYQQPRFHSSFTAATSAAATTTTTPTSRTNNHHSPFTQHIPNTNSSNNNNNYNNNNNNNNPTNNNPYTNSFNTNHNHGYNNSNRISNTSPSPFSHEVIPQLQANQPTTKPTHEPPNFTSYLPSQYSQSQQYSASSTPQQSYSRLNIQQQIASTSPYSNTINSQSNNNNNNNSSSLNRYPLRSPYLSDSNSKSNNNNHTNGNDTSTSYIDSSIAAELRHLANLRAQSYLGSSSSSSTASTPSAAAAAGNLTQTQQPSSLTGRSYANNTSSFNATNSNTAGTASGGSVVPRLSLSSQSTSLQQYPLPSLSLTAASSASKNLNQPSSSSATASQSQSSSYTPSNSNSSSISNTSSLAYKPNHYYLHNRTSSTQNINDENDYYNQQPLKSTDRPRSSNTFTSSNLPFSRQNSINNYNNDSLSPSKRVTFNLARNTYTDVEQIEQRLIEQSRQRSVSEFAISAADASTRLSSTFPSSSSQSASTAGATNYITTTSQTAPPQQSLATSAIPSTNNNQNSSGVTSEDLSRRFDNAIQRSERIINDFMRIGRDRDAGSFRAGLNPAESQNEVNQQNLQTTPKQQQPQQQQQQQQPQQSFLHRGSLQPQSQQQATIESLNSPSAKSGVGYNPSRSKSPIKSSLKRTSSFSSPSKPILTGTSLQSQPLSTRFDIGEDSPLSNQTNKVINTNTAAATTSTTKNEKPANTNQVQSYAYSPHAQKDTRGSSIPQNSFISPNVKQAIQQQFDENNGIQVAAKYLGTVSSNTKTTSGTANSNNNSNSESNSIASELKETKSISNNSGVSADQSSGLSASNSNSNTVAGEGNIGAIQSTNPNSRRSSSSGASTAVVVGKKGILKYSDGSRYDGEIVNNQRHGFGTLMSNEFAVIYQGNWANDTYHGPGKFFNPMSENLKEDCYDYSDFDIALSSFWESYDGEFYEGKLHGFGTLMLSNGEKLVGNFKKGRISGKGTFYPTKGPAVTASWEDNRLIEKL